MLRLLFLFLAFSLAAPVWAMEIIGLKEHLSAAQKILVVCSEENGLGDIIAAKKMVRDLIQRGRFPADRIIFTGNTRAAKIFAQNNPDGVSIQDSDDIDFSQIGLQVVIPTSGGVNMVDFGASPVVILQEYNIKFGFRQRELAPWAQYANMGIDDGKVDQQNLTIGLQLESMDADQVAHRQEKGQGLRQEHGVDKGRLYFGHTSKNSSWYGFVDAILRTQPLNDDLTFWIGKDIAKLGGDFLHWFDQLDFFLQKAAPQVARLRLVSNKNTYLSRDDNADGAGHTITLMFQPLSHQDSLALQQVAERPTIVTGDQSLGEAISFNKQWIYEVNHHKSGVQNAIAHQMENLELWDFPILALTRSFEDASAVIRNMYKGLNAENFDALNQNMHQDYYPRFEERAQTALSHRDKLSQVQQYCRAGDEFQASPAHMPIGSVSLLNCNQISAMRIDYDGFFAEESAISRSFPADAQFKTAMVRSGRYFVKRVK